MFVLEFVITTAAYNFYQSFFDHYHLTHSVAHHCLITAGSQLTIRELRMTCAQPRNAVLLVPATWRTHCMYCGKYPSFMQD